MDELANKVENNDKKGRRLVSELEKARLLQARRPRARRVKFPIIVSEGPEG
jgi:hypothetical protein